MSKLKNVLFFLVTTLAWQSSFGQQSQKDFNFRVEGNLVKMKQPKSNDCWATVTTMMYCWKDNKAYTIEDVLKKHGEGWVRLFKENKGLSAEKKIEFLQLVGFKSLPPANHLLEVYIELMQQYGPVWVTTSSTASQFSPHAQLLIGAEVKYDDKGDIDYKKSKVLFIDPLKGKVKKQTAWDFAHEFENEARYIVDNHIDMDFRIQILHW